jgi:hypothetical protein
MSGPIDFFQESVKKRAMSFVSERVMMGRKEQGCFYYFGFYSFGSGSALHCLET